MTLFQQVKPVPADPILGLVDIFRADNRTDKVNLTFGVYQDDLGRTPILESVRLAERRLFQDETTKEYYSMSGHPLLGKLIPQLLWPEPTHSPPVALATFQAPGGSGALRVVADFLRCEAPDSTVWISEPSWPNHLGIFQSCGLAVRTYRYFDDHTAGVDLDGLLADMQQTEPGDVIVLHGCCHNPTGADLTDSQWLTVGQALRQRELLPVVDLAYQGFAQSIADDAAGVRILAQTNGELFCCLSFSKTFGLYRERAGALMAVGTDPNSIEAVASRLRICVRTNYSNPPAHGGAIVATILADDQLKTKWEGEVAAMRYRIANTRAQFVQHLQDLQSPRDFSVFTRQHGMFALTGLTRTQVNRLRDEHAIYLVGSGRMNIAGLNESNIRRVAQSIVSVQQAM